jgi:hypothetical protein
MIFGLCFDLNTWSILASYFGMRKNLDLDAKFYYFKDLYCKLGFAGIFGIPVSLTKSPWHRDFVEAPKFWFCQNHGGTS